ncbi:discoidin domain-containing protein [Pseudomonas sp. HK3]
MKGFITGLLMLSTTCSWATICEDAVPLHTEANNYIIDESSNYLMDHYRGWQVFDNNPSTMWLSGGFVDDAWVRYFFNQPTQVDQYTIHFTNGTVTTRAPKDWELQAFNGASWVPVDIRQNETNWQSSEKRSYAVANPGSYSQYRLYVFDDNDDRPNIVVLSIGELELRTCSCTETERKVPYLTDASPQLNASSHYSSYYPWLAFDDNLSTFWLSAVYPSITTIEYDLQQATEIVEYTLTYANGSITSRAPKSFELQGWNGYQWLQLDYRENQTNWQGFESRTYAVTYPGSYSKYRVYFTEDNDARAPIVMLSLSDIALMSCAN